MRRRMSGPRICSSHRSKKFQVQAQMQEFGEKHIGLIKQEKGINTEAGSIDSFNSHFY